MILLSLWILRIPAGLADKSGDKNCSSSSLEQAGCSVATGPSDVGDHGGAPPLAVSTSSTSVPSPAVSPAHFDKPGSALRSAAAPTLS